MSVKEASAKLRQIKVAMLELLQPEIDRLQRDPVQIRKHFQMTNVVADAMAKGDVTHIGMGVLMRAVMTAGFYLHVGVEPLGDVPLAIGVVRQQPKAEVEP